MKHNLFGRLAAAVVLLLGAATAFAHDFEVNGIYYNKNSDGTTVSVTYEGDWSNAYVDEYSGIVAIPASVTYSGKAYSVTSIGNGAFSDCGNLTTVEIPSSITLIGKDAFSGCSGLTRVDITDLKSWCNITFENGESNPLYYTYYFFLNGTHITNLIIPNTITKINDYAFYGYTELMALEIPNSVTSIGKQAFCFCANLTAVEISNSVTSIGDQAFKECYGLRRVDITDLESWCNITFSGWESNPLHYAHHLYLNSLEITNLIIPNTITKINNYTFHGWSSLTAIEIPNSVTTIGNYAFYGCSSLAAIEIPNSVTSIGEKAFGFCSGLKAVEIPNSVTTIGNYAFHLCI